MQVSADIKTVSFLLKTLIKIPLKESLDFDIMQDREEEEKEEKKDNEYFSLLTGCCNVSISYLYQQQIQPAAVTSIHIGQTTRQSYECVDNESLLSADINLKQVD